MKLTEIDGLYGGEERRSAWCSADELGAAPMSLAWSRLKTGDDGDEEARWDWCLLNRDGGEERREIAADVILGLEEVRRLRSRSVPSRPRAEVFTSSHFQKTNTLQTLMSARGLRGADKRGLAALLLKNKHNLSEFLTYTAYQLHTLYPYGNIQSCNAPFFGY